MGAHSSWYVPKIFWGVASEKPFLHEYTELCDVVRKISQLPRVQSTLGHSMHAITVCGSPYVTHCDSTSDCPSPKIGLLIECMQSCLCLSSVTKRTVS